MLTRRKPNVFGDLDFGRREVGVVRHTLHVRKDTGRDVRSVQLRFGVEGARFTVEPDDLDDLIAELDEAREWLGEQR